METSEKPNKNYFTKDTEIAIIRYNTELDIDKKNKIYENEIHYAFFKLTENLIHTFKFYYTDVDNLQDLQFEVIQFLMSKMHLFDPSKGAKAYSYFGTIAKRYLIIYNQKNYKKRVESIVIGNLEGDSDLNETSKQTIHENLLDDSEPEEEGVMISNKHDKLSDFIDNFIEHCTKNIYEIFPDKKGVDVQDARIADAILELFRKRDKIDIFNKKALYIYIREIVDVKTPKITKVADKLYDIFKDKWVFYLENGHYKF
jgi:hypothetical protein